MTYRCCEAKLSRFEASFRLNHIFLNAALTLAYLVQQRLVRRLPRTEPKVGFVRPFQIGFLDRRFYHRDHVIFPIKIEETNHVP